MAINYPTSLDTLTNPVSTDITTVVDHATQHANANDILEALEAKLGITGSAVNTTVDYKLNEVTGGDKALGKSATQTITNKTIDAASNTLVGVATSTSTTTFTNKRITARVSTSTADAAEPTLNTDNYDMLVITGQTNNITSMTTNLSEYLKATDFGFNIPSGATIDGIVVEVEKKYDTYTVQDAVVKIVKGGSLTGTNKAIAGDWSSTESYITYGSSTELWGTTWSYGDINSSNFGVALSCEGTQVFPPGAGVANVDHIRITVYYTGGGSSNQGIMF